jgi:hypothetical protein
MAITQAAGQCPEQILGLVYVAAFLPADGQSLTDLVAYPEAAGDQVQAMPTSTPPTTARSRPRCSAG